MTGENRAASGGEADAAGPVSGPALSLDLGDGTLVRGGARLRLRPKTLGVLRVLVERRGAVVRQEELKSLVWGTRFGNDAGPKQCIRELRRLLEDSPDAPRCIETVGRSGYRLLVPVAVLGAPGAEAGPIVCVGRERELAALAARGAAAEQGGRAIVLVAGEAGAGKTRLTDAFIASLAGPGSPWVGRGQCVPHEQAREPYGPLIDALGTLAEGKHGALVLRILRESAPSWLPQIPGLSNGPDPVRAYADAGPLPADRMLREFNILMDRLTQHVPGVLVLEDLHWADASTLAWLASWGLRRSAARLLVTGTYRSDEADEREDLGMTLRVLARAEGVETLRLTVSTTQRSPTSSRGAFRATGCR